jgi:hypothetical protein
MKERGSCTGSEMQLNDPDVKCIPLKGVKDE